MSQPLQSVQEPRAAGREKTRQFSTFYVADRLYGIEVTQVQEVTRPLPITRIHLAPAHVKGLINLRGQIATAIGLRELFGLPMEGASEKMSVVCRLDGALLAFLVDRIGDVIEVPQASFELPPETVAESVRRFMQGVYKLPDSILSVVDINNLSAFLSK